MKKSTVFAIGLLVGGLNSSMHCADKQEHKFTLVSAKPGEDLSFQKEMIKELYLYHTNEDQKEYTARAVDTNFAIVEKWVNQQEQGKHFFNLLDRKKLVGGTTVEELDNERLAIHLSATLPEYASDYPVLLKLIQKEFPHAKTISTTSSSKIEGLQTVLEMLGFVRDDAFKGNPEMSAVVEESVGYTMHFDQASDTKE